MLARRLPVPATRDSVDRMELRYGHVRPADCEPCCANDRDGALQMPVTEIQLLRGTIFGTRFAPRADHSPNAGHYSNTVYCLQILHSGAAAETNIDCLSPIGEYLALHRGMFRYKVCAILWPNQGTRSVVHFAVHLVGIARVPRAEQHQQTRETKAEASHASCCGGLIANVLIGSPAKMTKQMHLENGNG
jgi:hypothetical protein